MSAHIDHGTEAQRLIAWADNLSLPPENVSAISSMAQAHATLALVEQQRLANIIALAITPGSTMSAVASEAVRSAEVREALGLA